ncbi:MAG: aspartate carbamoyltransferase catalytic subunit [Bacteroidia bacterium]|nr:aspartate carbamoyltransferase catalytic subunit [Bacteroidia bacterium]MDW8159191.1 aspartate carbamoyltransferase catalytic subunit [Bacteroidia bacterium]
MARSQLSVKHLLGIKELQVSDIEIIFQTAAQFKTVLERSIKKVPSLKEITVVNLFFESSTRTRVSFELAAKRLSAELINFSASTSSVKKGETLLDTVQNILAMKVDVVVIRHPSPGAPHFLSTRIPAIIINAGDGAHEHPTQALLDCFTLQQKFGTLKGLKVAIIGDILHSRVALSNIWALTKLGAQVRLCGPSTLLPPYIESLGVTTSYELMDTLQWCDVANVLRIQHERQKGNYLPSLREYHQYFGITPEVLEKVRHPITILHPGPINRGVEISSEVADGPHSLILDQVLNGVAIRMAVLYLLAANPS